MSIYAEIRAHITGRIAITEAEADYLERTLPKFPGRHIEIGCLWGATAILAALAKQEHVITIDHMSDDYWDNGDPACDMKRCNQADILDNFARFKVAHKISLVHAESYPWPLPADLRFATAFIDGDHAYAGVLRDWESVKGITSGLIFFHDYGYTHPGVKQAVDEVARKEKKWRLSEVVDTLAIFEKVK